MIPPFRRALARLAGHVVDHLGRPAIYRPNGGNPIDLTVSFTASPSSVDLLPGRARGWPDSGSSSSPRAFLRLADLPAAPRPGDTLSINGTAWEVWDVQPDGESGATLILKLAEPA